MTYTENRTLGLALAGSLAVHGILGVLFALWIGLASIEHTKISEPMHQTMEVSLVFPNPLPPAPAPPEQKPAERYIRTTQNSEASKAPEKSDFVSDRDTVAMAKATPTPNGEKPLPTMQGVDFPTNELADRTMRDGETKNDSAPPPPQASAAMAVVTPAPPPPTPAPTTPQMKAPDPPPPPAPKPPPPPQIAKKEDSPAETMMKELDTALAMQEQPKVEPKPQDQPPEERKPEAPPAKDMLPTMRNPDEMAVPPAIPAARAVAATPKPEKDAFQPETRRSATKGTISNAGKEDSVSAAATPVGRYMRQVTSAIEKKWHQYRVARADAVEPGKMGLRFFVNRNGKVEDLEFLFKESNPLMEDFTIEAILKADIPPIPKELIPILEKERVEITYDIVIHP